MTELGFPLLRTRAIQLQGDAEVGLAQLRQGAMQTTEMLYMQPFYLALQVEV